MGQQKQQAHIEQWQVVPFGWRGEGRLMLGYVSGHPILGDCNGRQVRTSPLEHIDTQAGIAITENTIYTLGTPAPEPAQA